MTAKEPWAQGDNASGNVVQPLRVDPAEPVLHNATGIALDNIPENDPRVVTAHPDERCSCGRLAAKVVQLASGGRLAWCGVAVPSPGTS
jgi:hypothetical protein